MSSSRNPVERSTVPAVQALQPGKSMPVVVELLLLLAVVGSCGAALRETPPTRVLAAETETVDEVSSVLDDRDWRRNVEAIV